MKEIWLICGPPIFTSVARWEAHLAWLHSRPNMLGQEERIRRAEEHIAWLKELGDPYPDHAVARAARTASDPTAESDLEAIGRKLDRHRQRRREEDQG